MSCDTYTTNRLVQCVPVACDIHFTSLFYSSLDLHREIEELMSMLKKNASNMVNMEQEFVQSRDYSNMEVSRLQYELSKLRDKYDRWGCNRSDMGSNTFYNLMPI